jgi:hypothetical protein
VASIATIFSLKLDNKDFKAQLQNAQNFSKQYQDEIADSLIKMAKLEAKRAKQLRTRATLEEMGTEKAKKAINAINRRIKATNSLIQAERKHQASLHSLNKINKQRIDNLGKHNTQIKKEKCLFK